jgi:hypothetical protein
MAKQSGKQKSNRRRPRPDLSYQVFISHATADKWLAVTLCEKIEGVGATTFRDDRDIDGGDDIPEKIRLAIKRSAELVVLLTPESVNREWVKHEVGAAWGKRRGFRITAILCHVTTGALPTMIQGKKAILLNEFDQFLLELKARAEEPKR